MAEFVEQLGNSTKFAALGVKVLGMLTIFNIYDKQEVKYYRLRSRT
jgi:hypothetical protein